MGLEPSTAAIPPVSPHISGKRRFSPGHVYGLQKSRRPAMGKDGQGVSQLDLSVSQTSGLLGLPRVRSSFQGRHSDFPVPRPNPNNIVLCTGLSWDFLSKKEKTKPKNLTKQFKIEQNLHIS